MTKKAMDAQVRRYSLKVIRQKNYPYKDGAYKTYRELGGKLTYSQIVGKKKTTTKKKPAKRKGC